MLFSVVEFKLGTSSGFSCMDLKVLSLENGLDISASIVLIVGVESFEVTIATIVITLYSFDNFINSLSASLFVLPDAILNFRVRAYLVISL